MHCSICKEKAQGTLSNIGLEPNNIINCEAFRDLVSMETYS
jgi:hypothetical protein